MWNVGGFNAVTTATVFGTFVIVVVLGFADVFSTASAVFSVIVVLPGGGTSFVRPFFFAIGFEVKAARFPVLG